MAHRFSRYNQVIVCYCCKRRTTDQVGSGTDLCGLCYDSAGWQNHHSDTRGAACNAQDCPTCQGVDCLHEVPVPSH